MKKQLLFILFSILNLRQFITCGQVDNDYSPDCEQTPVPGADTEILVINFEDWGNATITKTAKTITDIALASTKKAYSIESSRGQTAVSITSSKLEGLNLWIHQITTKINSQGATEKALLEDLAQGSFVILARVKTGEAADQFQVLGSDSGLTGEDAAFDTTTSGMTTILLKNSTDPAEFEKSAGFTFWDNDLPTTLAKWEALKVAAS